MNNEAGDVEVSPIFGFRYFCMINLCDETPS